MYSNNSFSNNFSDDSVQTNINSNSNEGGSNSNHPHESLDLSNDYQIAVNPHYLSNELLHHQLTKKLEVVQLGYQHPKPQEHQNIIIYTDSTSPSATAPILNLTPKFTTLEYQTVEDGHIINDDSDKSDCDDFLSSKHQAKQSLPHKKRIAKKLNSSQSYYSLMMPGGEETRGVVSSAQFECNICAAVFIDQLQFFVHLKEHYEPPVQKELDKKREEEEELQVHVKELSYKDEFNEFESDAEDVMEDLRKEVEKVVETIGENEPQWDYQVCEIESPADEQQAELQIYTESCEDPPSYDEIATTHECSEMIEEEHHDNNQYDSDDAEDDKPLEQLRQETLQISMKTLPENKKHHSDEDFELTECLKKIHNFKCSYDQCGKAFNSRTALGYHIKTHSVERRYVCDQCGKKFLTNGALKVHQRLHSDTRPYQCNLCDKSFRQWGDLRYHETSIHSNKKDHVCEFCAKAFARKYSLVIHRRIHTGERNYKCQECGKSFRASSYLLNHTRIHTGEKPYICTTLSCQKKFRVVGDLKRHMKIHERSKNSSPKDKKVNLIKKETVNECVDLSKEEDKTSLSNSKAEDFSSSKKGKKVSKHKKK